MSSGLLTDRDGVVAYLEFAHLSATLADEADHITVREVTAGNMNRVFIAEGPLGSLAIKQAPPFINVIGEGAPMDPSRIGAEARAYAQLARLAPDTVPAIAHLDLDEYVMVMEDLSELTVLRDGLVDQVTARLAGEATSEIDCAAIGSVVGRFIGELTFSTSETSLGRSAFEELTRESSNPDLCALTLQYVLGEPYRDVANNHWVPALEGRVRQLWNDSAVAAAVERVSKVFTESPQGLLHGDLHTGSVMVRLPNVGHDLDVKVFDPEFSFVGPIGMDLGLFWANMRIAAMAADAAGQTDLAVMRASAVDTSREAFRAAWQDTASPEFLDQVEREAWGFAGAEMIRRVIGVARAADLELLPADECAAASVAVFDEGRSLLLDPSTGPVAHI
ncbi:5'-methylthioribose kinase [Rhodoglobus vestalii]|uniref:5'-methylthioribose kinase n=1 Tax=Rhodoglobus vestalii TaxID=193384 RepID=A0A8H2PXX8_9MICO|nr:phosphotransferase [Rhodoglobus vestalii]TQO20680.1 5'-methylthioribose kinase [Rhodoglobus vestalii]